MQEVTPLVEKPFATEVTEPLCFLLGAALLAEQCGFAEGCLRGYTDCLPDCCDLWGRLGLSGEDVEMWGG